MNLDELESAVLALPERDRRALAYRIWESVELSEVEDLLRECDKREQESDAASDGWADADEFLESLKSRL